MGRLSRLPLFRHRLMAMLATFMLLASAVSTASSSQPSYAQNDQRSFPETGKSVRGRFLEYWNQNGGLAQQGYPITEEIQELSDTDGKQYTMQYFQRAVFEKHPEYAKPSDVLLSLLGTFNYQQKYPGADGAPNQQANPDSSRLFSQTGKTIGGTFRQYWESNGGLAQQGYPISDEFLEVSKTDGKTYTVQYFQRAVFELHPEQPDPKFRVLLSLLGTFRYEAKYGDGGPIPTAAVVTPQATSTSVPLSSPTSAPTSAATSVAANNRIAFVSMRDGNKEIYSVNPNGTGETRLTNSAGDDDNPSWSPDGTRLAFDRNNSGNTDIYLMDANGGNLVRLTTDAAADTEPAWSPNGMRLAFVSQRNGNSELYVMNADGTGQKRLTNDPSPDSGPSWSPNGARVAFARLVGGDRHHLLLINADGTGAQDIFDMNYSDAPAPAWSPAAPDGSSRIAFRYLGRIHTIKPDGTELTRITDDMERVARPAWSPDGSKIVFESNAYATPNDIYYKDAVTGGAATRVTTNGNYNQNPSWGR